MKTFFILSFVLFCNLLCSANTNNGLSHQVNNPTNITTIYQYFREQGMLKLPINYDANFNKEIALLKRKREIARAVYPYRIINSPFYVNVNKKNTTHNDTETSIHFLFEETNGKYILGIVGAVSGDHNASKSWLVTFAPSNNFIDYIPIGESHCDTRIIEAQINADFTVLVRELTFPGYDCIVDVKTFQPLENLKGQRIDRTYKITPEGKFELTKEVKYQPQIYTPAVLSDRNRLISEGGEKPIN